MAEEGNSVVAIEPPVNTGTTTTTTQSAHFIFEETIEEEEDEENIDGMYMQLNNSFTEQRYRYYAITAIYTSVVLEAFAWTAISHFYIPYLVDSSSEDSAQVLFSSIVFTSAFLSGFFTDKLIPRFWAIFVGFLLYLIGYGMLVITSYNEICEYDSAHSSAGSSCMLGFETEMYNKSCACTVLFSLFVLGFARGVVYASTLVFGANQISDSNYIAVFVHVHYFSFELGCSLLYVLYGFTEETRNNSVSFVIVGACVCFASFVSFLAGTRFYQPEHTKHLVDPFMHILKAVSFHFYCNFPIFSSSNEDKGEVYVPEGEHDIVEARQVITVGPIERTYLDGVRRYFRLMIVFLVLVPFKAIFNDQDNLSALERQRMIWPLWAVNSKNEINGKMMWLTYGFSQFLNLALVPVMLLVWWVFLGNSRGFPFTRRMTRFRMVGGLLIGAFSVVLFGIMSVIKTSVYKHCVNTNSDPNDCVHEYRADGSTYLGSGLRIEWQIPQCIFIQLSEIMVQTTAVQLAYLEAPDNQHFRMNGKFVCLLFMSGVIGRAFGSFTSQWGESYYCDNIHMNDDEDCQLLEKRLSVYLFTVGGCEWIAALAVWLALEDYFKWTATGRGFIF